MKRWRSTVMSKTFLAHLGAIFCLNAGLTVAPFARAGESASHAGEAPVKLFPIVKDGKWGYMDEKGKAVIEPKYEGAWDFHEGMACVAVGPSRGYINAKGEMVIKPQFGWAGDFCEGLAFVNLHRKLYGKHVEWYQAVTGTGFCDKNGKVVMRLQYNTRATDFSCGLSYLGGKYLDPTGKPVASEAVEGDAFSEGMAVAAAKKGGPWGYLARDTMKFAIQPQFAAARPFSDGLAAVAEGTVTAKDKKLKWGYVDKSGKQVIERKFDDAGPFAEGLAPVRAGGPSAGSGQGKWGYVDKSGNMTIDAKYDCAWRFSEGLGRVLVGEKQGYVDRGGKPVIEPKFDGAWEFDKGLARVMVGDKEGYIDCGGKYVWGPTDFWPPEPAAEPAKGPPPGK